MHFKLTIANAVEVPVKFTLNDAGKKTPFAFHLTGARMTQAEIRGLLDDTERTTRELLLKQFTGWRGQTPVVDEADQPAAFSPEAFECLLSLAGMEQIVLQAYMVELAAADTAAGKAKN